jgi:arylsulfatase/uncharacterized sulfatase
MTRHLVPLAALLLATAAAPVASPVTPPARPNIVVLLADDWGFTDVGAFGGEMRTPNIDALAQKGVRFSNFHVAGSCSPTRAMLQTGVSSHRAGLGNMPETIPPLHQGRRGYDAVLNNRVTGFANQLQAAGYRTYFTGKWHLGHTPRNLPNAFGYDRAFALSQSGADNFADKPNLMLYDKADWTEDGKPATLPKDFYSSRFLVDKTIQYIDSGAATGKPFLASVNFFANHIPIQAPDADIAAYKGRYDAGWTALRNERRAAAIAKGVMPAGMPMVTMDTTTDWNAQTSAQKATRARAMEAYGGMATAMDREVGRLVAHLKATGQYDNTIFVFLSDNGGEAIDPLEIGSRVNAWIADYYYDIRPQEQGRPGSFTAIGTSFASAVSSPLRGYKFTASEGGLRVPMIIAWPGNKAVKAGSIANGFTYATDVPATLLNLAGVIPQQGSFAGRKVEPMTGKDLTPLLTGTATSVRDPATPLGYELSGNAVLFRGDLKLVKNLPPYGDGNWHLYDIVKDPGETRDLATTMPTEFTQLKADYVAYAKAEGVLPMPPGYSAPQQVQDNARRERLEPRLRAFWPWLAGALGLIIGGTFAWRRRTNSAPPAAGA